ncbi:ATP-binding protein [Streptomyces sp. NPDC008150]|uniref:ATP-binding protein n=1 Tax=Streptomyces sp. NPDC008150 TaxID=3364816 RepID=UPI0036EC091E
MPWSSRRYFDAEPESVGHARDFVAVTLTAWGLRSVVEDVRLCVSELASNAVVHGTRDDHGFLVRLDTHDEDFVRLEVHDSRDVQDSLRRVRVRHSAETDTAGRGLRIVDLVADSWGVEARRPLGKILWARFRAFPDSPEQLVGHVAELPPDASIGTEVAVAPRLLDGREQPSRARRALQ